MRLITTLLYSLTCQAIPSFFNDANEESGRAWYAKLHDIVLHNGRCWNGHSKSRLILSEVYTMGVQLVLHKEEDHTTLSLKLWSLPLTWECSETWWPLTCTLTGLSLYGLSTWIRHARDIVYQALPFSYMQHWKKLGVAWSVRLPPMHAQWLVRAIRKTQTFC